MFCQKCQLPEHSKVRQNCGPCNVQADTLWCGKVKHQPKCPFTDQLSTNLSDQQIQDIIESARLCICCQKLSFSLVKYGKLKYCRQCVYRLNHKLFFEFNLTPEVQKRFPNCHQCNSLIIFKPQGIEQQMALTKYPMFYNWDFDKDVYRLRKENSSVDDILEYFEQKGGLLCMECYNNNNTIQEEFVCFDCKQVFGLKCLQRRWKGEKLCVNCYFELSVQQTISENSSTYEQSYSTCQFNNCPFCQNTSTACQFDHNNMFIYDEYKGCSSPGMSILFGAPNDFIANEIEKCTPICHQAHNLTSVVERKMGYFGAKRAWKQISSEFEERKREVLEELKKHYADNFQRNLMTVIIHLFDTSLVDKKEKKQLDRYTAECPDCNITFKYMKSAHRGCRRNKCPFVIPDEKSFDWEDHVHLCYVNRSCVLSVIQQVTGYDQAMKLLREIEPVTEMVVKKRFEWELWFWENCRNWSEELQEIVEKNNTILDQHRKLLSSRKRSRPE